MKKVILSIIKREKVYNKNYEADSREIIDNEAEHEKFYEPLAEILTLIYKYEIGGGTYDAN